MNEIVQQIIDNREGGTASTTGIPLPSFGYWVGGAGPCLTIPAHLGLIGSHSLLSSFVGHASSDWVGWWTDGDDGKFYLDCVTWIPDVDKANRLAAERGEIAFWDIQSDAEIRTEA